MIKPFKSPRVVLRCAVLSCAVACLAGCATAGRGVSLEEGDIHNTVIEPSEWKCVQVVDRPPVWATPFRVVEAAQQPVLCTAPLIPVDAGHYEAEIEIGLDLPSHVTTLGQAVGLSMQSFDGEGRLLRSTATRLGKAVPETDFTAGLRDVPAAVFTYPTPPFRLTLRSDEYPLDGGWLPEGVRQARLALVVEPSVTARIGRAHVRRSKWNLSLRERVAAAQREPSRRKNPASEQPDLLVVNSQGPAALQLSRLGSALRHLPGEGIQGISIELHPHDIEGDLSSASLHEMVAILARYCAAHPGFRFGIAFNPYWRKEGRAAPPLTLGPAIRSGRLYRLLKPLLERGAAFLLLRTDDFAPKGGGHRFAYTLTAADRIEYGSLAGLHGALIDDLAQRMRADGIAAEVYFVPPWYNPMFVRGNEQEARAYFAELATRLRSSINIVWTGPTVRSLIVDEPQAASFRQFTAAPALVLWDNTLFARRHQNFWRERPDRVHLTSFFEPYSVRLPLSYLASPSGTRSFVFLNGDLTERGQIQYITAARYFSDPRHYRPEAALWGYLTARFGAERAALLLEFDELLGRLRAAFLEQSGPCEKLALFALARERGEALRSMLMPSEPALAEELTEMLDLACASS